MATIIELGIIVSEGQFPTIAVEDHDKARTLVAALNDVGIGVNLREGESSEAARPETVSKSWKRTAQEILKGMGR